MDDDFNILGFSPIFVIVIGLLIFSEYRSDQVNNAYDRFTDRHGEELIEKSEYKKYFRSSNETEKLELEEITSGQVSFAESKYFRHLASEEDLAEIRSAKEAKAALAFTKEPEPEPVVVIKPEVPVIPKSDRTIYQHFKAYEPNSPLTEKQFYDSFYNNGIKGFYTSYDLFCTITGRSNSISRGEFNQLLEAKTIR
jgi:hypothetical protein